MTRRALIPVALATLLACGGCTARRGSTVPTTPSAAPKLAPKPSVRPAAAAGQPAAGTGSANATPPADPAATAPAATAPAAAAGRPAEAPPAATASTYVFSPRQAVAAPPEPSSVGPRDTAPHESAPGAPPEGTSDKARGELQLVVVASAREIATGAIMTVDVMASSSSAVVDAPLHLTFDPSVVEFVEGTPGDFLSQGGSSVVFFTDGRSRPGDVAVAAGRVERVQGASGSGLLCRVTFRGVGAGTTPVNVGRAKAWGVEGEELTVLAGGTTAVVR